MFALVVAAEGADAPEGGVVGTIDRGGRRHYGGVGEAIAQALEAATGGSGRGAGDELVHTARSVGIYMGDS